MLEFNIAPNTQIGKIEIPEKVYDHENVYCIEEEKYSRSGEFIENMVTDNHIEFCHRWFKLGGVEECLDDIDEFFEYNSFGKSYSWFMDGKNLSPIVPTNSKTETPVSFENHKESPVIFYNNRPSEWTYDYFENKNKELV